jgi:nucleotide-binding universal stress UspA family protein
MAPTRVRIERILCPTDFSEFSQRALRRAVSLARWSEARVTVLHVVVPTPWALPAAAYGSSVTVPMDLIRTRREEVAQELERFVEPFLAEGVPLQTRLADGEPWREILAAAEAQPADLVVMGTHGRSGFEHLLLGSVTEKVLRRAPCPVLTVGVDDAAPAALPLFRRIVCAADLTTASQATLDLALSLAAENLARVTLLHVVEGLLGESGRELYRPVPDAARLRSGLVERARQQLAEAGRPAHSFCDVDERVETGKAWQEILRVAEETGADLVVLGAHVQGGLGRLFLGSTADRVVRQAPCPVLVVRETRPRRERAADPPAVWAEGSEVAPVGPA